MGKNRENTLSTILHSLRERVCVNPIFQPNVAENVN